MPPTPSLSPPPAPHRPDAATRRGNHEAPVAAGAGLALAGALRERPQGVRQEGPPAAGSHWPCPRVVLEGKSAVVEWVV